MIRFWGRVQDRLGHTDSTKVTRLLIHLLQDFWVDDRLCFLSLKEQPVCFTFQVPLVLICEYKDLLVSHILISRIKFKLEF